MSFDWDKYRNLADELRKRPLEDEAAQRSAISRLYYSVYWKARNVIEAEGVNVPDADSHKFVWKQYQRRGGRTQKSIGDNGDRLHQYRKKADYESEITNLEQTVNASFVIADNVLYYLKQIQPSDEEAK